MTTNILPVIVVSFYVLLMLVIVNETERYYKDMPKPNIMLFGMISGIFIGGLMVRTLEYLF